MWKLVVTKLSWPLIEMLILKDPCYRRMKGFESKRATNTHWFRVASFGRLLAYCHSVDMEMLPMIIVSLL